MGRYGLIKQRPRPYFGLVHAFYAVTGGFAFSRSCDDNAVEKSFFEVSTDPSDTVEVPTFDTLLYITEHFPDILTDIPEEFILDRAESSSIGKALLIVQVAWFCTNCAARLFQRLPLSLFEVSTAAHALCTLTTYFVWWSKPLNVPTPTLMREKRAQEVYALLMCSDSEYDRAVAVAVAVAKKQAEGDSSAPTGRYESAKIDLAANALRGLLPAPEPPRQPRFTESSMFTGTWYNRSPNRAVLRAVTVVIPTMVYGSLHFLAWNDDFPTPLERQLWRVSSCVVTFSGLVISPLVWGVPFGGLSFSRLRFTLRNSPHIITIGILCAHMYASIFLTVESIRQLFFLDAAVYQLPRWSNYWPHFS